MTTTCLDGLYARRRFGMCPGLETMRSLLDCLGHPEAGLAAVHVAGTNGKGSVTALVAEVLAAAGLRVGRYTSPHLLRFNERFFLDGRPVDDAALMAAAAEVEAAARVVEQAGGRPPTFFECATAMAFVLFRRAGLRLAVIETGLGGRWDATNVLTPLISVITRIGLDHCEQLGNTLELIAAEKAGIIKPGRPVVCGAMPDEARGVIRQAAADRGCRFTDVVEEVNVTGMAVALDGLSVRMATSARDLGKVRTPLAGLYQVENLATAVATLEAVAAELQVTLEDAAFREGLGRVCWPARFQLAVREPPVIVDGAHNPDGAAALREALRRVKFRGPMALVAGFCDDKDTPGFLQPLASMFRRAWAVPVPSPRTRPAAATATWMQAAGIGQVAATDDVPAALAAAQAWALAEGGLVLVCGSLFLAGQALDLLHAYPWPLLSAQSAADPNEQLRPG
ncbi:MAG: bifunctional folylpolyglutamate synthase/dihydrofolate synthase [Kiritimatiellia bacterium]